MSSLYRNILVAVDGSPDGEAALEHAAELARDQRARLTLLTAIPPIPATALLATGAAPPRGEVVKHYSEMLRRATDALPADVSVTTLLVEGPAAKALIERARAGAFDLIVMGSHGHGLLHQSLLGCVSESVLPESPIAVLLTRAPEPAPVGAPAPVDSSFDARPAAGKTLPTLRARAPGPT